MRNPEHKGRETQGSPEAAAGSPRAAPEQSAAGRAGARERCPIDNDMLRRLEFEQIISSASTSFINIPAAKIDRNIVSTLKAIGRHMGAQRCMLFGFSEDNLSVQIDYMWASPGFDSGLAPGTSHPVSEFRWWMECIRNFESIAISRLSDFEDVAASERDALAAVGAKSVLAVPVSLRGWLRGFLALHAVEEEREWLPEDIPLLKMAGETLASALERKRSEEQVRALNAHLELRLQRLGALREIDTAISSNFDLRTTLEVFLKQAVAQLGVSCAAVQLLDHACRRLRYAAAEGFSLTDLNQSTLKLGEQSPGQAGLWGSSIRADDLGSEEGASVSSPALGTGQYGAYYAVPLVAKGRVEGVLEVLHRHPLQPDPEWLDYLETLAGQAGIAIDSSNMLYRLEQKNRELLAAYDATIEGWSRALDLRDRETQGHSERVTEMTLHVARRMGVPEGTLEHVRRGALLHDIGKMGIPDGILLKPGALTPDERGIMQRHTDYAVEMLWPVEFLRPALDIPHHHHERWDGTGYPDGLAGEDIPLAARIFAVVDVWDALVSDRPYREGWPAERVLEHVRERAGTHFDPDVVRVFCEMVEEARRQEEEPQAA